MIILQWFGWCAAVCTLVLGLLYFSETRHGRRLGEAVADRLDPPAHTARVLHLVRSCSWCGCCEDLHPDLGPVDEWRSGAAMHRVCAGQYDRRRPQRAGGSTWNLRARAAARRRGHPASGTALPATPTHMRSWRARQRGRRSLLRAARLCDLQARVALLPEARERWATRAAALRWAAGEPDEPLDTLIRTTEGTDHGNH